MERRDFVKGISLLAGSTGVGGYAFGASPKPSPNDRAYWISRLTQVAGPVLRANAVGKLKEKMPVLSKGDIDGRKKVTYLEALGRTLAGLSPWLELGGDKTDEGKLREEFIQLALDSIRHAVDPASPDFMNFTTDRQPLVDAAFLAHALLRAPNQLWKNLDDQTKTNLIAALQSSRVIKPYYSNWLLFSAMVEAVLFAFTGEYDAMRVDYAIKEHQSWYKGDGVYGDGPDFHFDYYNSYVIQPMLLDISSTLAKESGEMKSLNETFLRRAQRYAAIQERLISPEGTFPVVGRSLAYRCGAFQLLAQVALQQQLPSGLSPSQVRSALTAVIRRTMDAANTFDKEGWLTIGLAGDQPEVGETYISTGSLYLCSVAFLPLGLPASDEFWSGPEVAWTSKKAFSGESFPIDKALS